MDKLRNYSRLVTIMQTMKTRFNEVSDLYLFNGFSVGTSCYATKPEMRFLKIFSAKIHFVVISVIFTFFVLLYFMLGSLFKNGELKPGTLVAASNSPGGRYRAEIKTTEQDTFYDFKLYILRSNVLLKEKSIIVPSGYHKPLISFEWCYENECVKVIIDHDFGDGNIENTLYIE